MCHLRSTPPRSEAFRHSGGDSRLCTSATVTLYLDVELSRDSLPGTEQKTSLGFMTAPTRSFWQGRPKGFLVIEMGPVGTAEQVLSLEQEGVEISSKGQTKAEFGLQKSLHTELRSARRLLRATLVLQRLQSEIMS